MKIVQFILIVTLMLTVLAAEAKPARVVSKNINYRPLIAQVKQKIRQKAARARSQTRLLKFTVAPAAPKATEEVTVFIQPLMGVTDSDTLLTAQFDGTDITAQMEHPARELWVFDAGSFSELRAHELTVQIFLQDKNAAQLITDAIQVLDTAIADLNTQIENETDPGIIADLTAQRDDKIAQKNELIGVLDGLKTEVGEETYSFQISEDPALQGYPKITAVAPNAIKAGVTADVVITGQNFGEAPVLRVDGNEVSGTWVGQDGIHASLPPLEAGLHSLEVRVIEGQQVKNVFAKNILLATDSDLGNPNTPPTAVADAVANPVALGSPVQVTAENSFDSNDKPLIYLWRFVSVPEGASLPNDGNLVSSDMEYSFTPSVPGAYVLKLDVSQSVSPNLLSAPSLVVVNVTAPANRVPVLSAAAMDVLVNGTQTRQILNQDPDTWQRHTYYVTTQGSLGTATVDANGLITYEAGATPGTDSIAVLAVDSGSPAKSQTVTITVNVADSNQAPVISSVLPVILNEKLPATLNVTVTGGDPDGEITEMIVDFGNGHVEHGTALYLQAFHNYMAYGTYNGTVTLKDNHGATTTENFTVNVTNSSQPVAKIALDKFSCASAPCTVTADATASSDDNGIAQYRWRWGNTAEYSGTDNESYTFNTPGTYRIRLRVRDAQNRQGEGAATVYVGVTAPPTGSPSSNDFRMGPSRENVVGTAITFDGTPSFDPNPSGEIIHYNWDFGCFVDGCTLYSPAAVVEHLYAEPTNYYPYLVTQNALEGFNGMPQYFWYEAINVTTGHAPRGYITANGVHATDYVWGAGPFAVNLDASESYDYDGTIVKYDWDFGDGTTGTGVRPTKIYDTPGVYFVNVRLEDNDGNYPVWGIAVEVLPEAMKGKKVRRVSSVDPIQKRQLIQACGRKVGYACYQLAEVYQEEGDTFAAGEVMKRACTLGYQPACGRKR